MDRDLEQCVKTAAKAARNGIGPDLPGLPERTFAEFFAGIGLMQLGLERQGWRAKFANDIDPKKHEMYSVNFENDGDFEYRVSDIHDLRGDEVPTVTLATAAFPCTDLSLAGERKGLKGKQSGALLGFLRILREMGDRRPPLVLLENVPGFLTSHRGQDFRQTLLELNDLGYGVDSFLIDAMSFVPQSRQRLFVVGVRDDVQGADNNQGLLQESVESDLRPRRFAERIRAEPEVRWRMLNFPAPPPTDGVLEDVLEDLPANSEEWWSRERCEYLLNQMSTAHRQLAQHMIESSVIRYGTVYRRMRSGRSMAELRADGISGCLRTPRGGSSRQILFEAGKGRYRVRLMTPREYARLQGVPDSYKINVPRNQALFGFGDAVCVPVIEWIAQHYLNVAFNQLLRGRVLACK